MESGWIILFIGLLLVGRLRAQDTWTAVPQDATRANLWSIAYGNRTLVAVGEEGAIVTYNYVDKVWLPRVSGTGVWLDGVGFGAGRFVIVGDEGAIHTSDDNGLTWTPRTSGTITRLNAAAYGNGRWLIVGEQGIVLTSPDGTTWTQRPALGTGFLRALAFGQGQFLIGGANGALFSTTDAVTFTPVPIGTTSDIEGAAISANRFWIVGSGGLRASATKLDLWRFAALGTSGPYYRGVTVRAPDEASAVGEIRSATFQRGLWGSNFADPAFLATAVARGEDELIAVGFGGNIARSSPHSSLQNIVTDPINPIYGGDLRLQALIGGTPLSYQWTRDGADIPGATQSELLVKNATPAQGLVYGVRVTTTVGISNFDSGPLQFVPAGRPEVRDLEFVSALPFASAVRVQPDGKLIVSGSFSVTVGGRALSGRARLNADGSLDPSFEPSSAPATPVHTAPDGRSYAQEGSVFFGGTARIVRFMPSGSPDASFAPLGQHHLVGIDSQGRVLAVDFTGGEPRLVRYLPSGARDSSYVTTPVVASSPAVYDFRSVKITDTGLYAVAVRFFSALTGERYSFFKFASDGGRDTSYQSPPEYLYDSHRVSFAYRPDGGLWQVRWDRNGGNSAYAATSYGPSGNPDGRYATLPDRSFYDIVAIEADGSLLAMHGEWSVGLQESKLIRVRPIAGRSGRLTNLSVRAFVASASDPLIAGFITSGNDTTRALVRAIGPGLVPYGVSDAMTDPRLTLTRDGAVAGTNDNWDSALASRFASVGAFALPNGSKDAGLESTVADGNYSVVVAPAPNDSGTGLVELYESADTSSAPRRFINVSARGPVSAARPLIVGFSISGDVPVTVLIRGAGPALANYGVANVLADPRLVLFRAETPLWENDRWSANSSELLSLRDAVARTGAFEFAFDSKDAAMLVTLAPGNYSAVVSGATGTTGIALVEVYEVR